MRTRSSKWLLLSLLAVTGCGSGPNSPTGPSVPPPAGGYTLSGLVAEPEGHPVAGASVDVRGQAAAMTDEAGRYSIGGLPRSPIVLELSKEGYEAFPPSEYSLGSDRVLNLLLTPMIKLVAGESRSVTLYGADRGYNFPQAYSECAAPCKLIRVTVPAPGSVTIQLTAGGPSWKLSVFTNDGNGEYCCSTQFTLSSGVVAAGEQVLYVRFADGLPMETEGRIDIATSFQPR